jgi:hypothetical protein
MKKILWLLSALILFFTSCVTTAPETMVSEPEEKKEEMVKEEVIETVIIDVYLVASESLSASDGIVDGYIEYEYDEMGNLLVKKEMDSEKKLISRLENEVSGNKIVRTQWFRGEENEPGIYVVLEYEGLNLVKETSFDVKEIAQSISTYEYDSNGNIAKWIVSSGDDVPMMITEYNYSGSQRTKATFLTPLGEMEGFIEYNWTGEKIESEITYDKDGDLEKSVVYEYIDGNLVKETHYKKTVISYTIEYELDGNGNAVNKKHFYRSGNQKAQWDYSYISVKKEVQL